MVAEIGESGHIARKIAATLVSIGKPAQFVHAAEASHGDLGMIGAEDAIFVFLNSSLAQAADVVLLPGAAEGCALGLAPTTRRR